MDASTVTHPMPLQLLSGPTDTRALPAEFRYTVREPVAVTVVFDAGSERPVEWIFARELLVGGLERETGMGDVVIGPAEDETGTPVIKISLSSPDGTAVMLAPAERVAAFIAETLRVVPTEIESTLIDIDVVLESLLKGA